jgi:outer membrane protein assembly factor BamB
MMSRDSSKMPSPRPDGSQSTRYWIPIGIVAIEAVTLGVAQYVESSEGLPRAECFLIKLSSLLLATILLFLWFVFLGPASRTLRRRVGIVGLVLVAILAGTLDIERVSGDIHIKFRFRWMPRADQTLPAASDQAAADANVDLTQTTPNDYPEFLGPGRLATLENIHLARDWTTQPPKLLWRQPIGAGWSSFAVVGHYAVTQEQRGEEELVTCYDVETGKLQWAHATPNRFQDFVAGIGPRATPTVHDGKVYALGALGELVCLEGATGRLLWHHDVITENSANPPQWGKSCSPLVYENKVIVSAGGADGKSLVAYDVQSGEPIWSAGDDASSYSSPTLLTLCGQPQIVIVNQKLVTAHDPADGHIFWQRDWPDQTVGSPNVSQPTAVGDDRVMVTKGYGVGSALWQIKREGDTWSVELIWRNNSLKTKFTNPVIRDGYAYGLDEGVLSCIDIATGARKWKKGKFDHGQVLLIDDMLLVQSEAGDVALVEATPEAFRELTRFSAVTGQSWNYPALSGRKLLVRTEQEAACYELPVVLP